jgi:hypothetical protein
MKGWELVLLPRLVAHEAGETVPYIEGLVASLSKPRRKMSRNHVGMAVVGEALRAWRALPNFNRTDLFRWQAARDALVEYLKDELEHGLWGPEVLATTPHAEYHVAIAAFARRVAVESDDGELSFKSALLCCRLGILCASLSDPTGAVRTAGWRVPLAKPGRGQRAPQHSGLTVFWRLVNDLPQEAGWRKGRWQRDPLYVGLNCFDSLLHYYDDSLGGARCAFPGPVPLRHTINVYRWDGGHQVVIPRPRPNFTGRTSGSKNPNGVCDWLRCEYGERRPRVTFGMLWQTPPPATPSNATEIVMATA